MTLVCATDFSDNAKPALLATAALAAKLSAAEVLLVTVVSPALEDQLTPEQRKELLDAIDAKLEQSAADMTRGRPGVRVRTKVLHGSPAQTLCDFAERKNAELLVIGSKGHSDSALLRLGGTSERVAVTAGVPVLVVREPEPWLAWERGERSLRVVVGVDWSDSSRPALDLVKLLRRGGACDVVVGHVYYGGDSMTRYGLGGTHSWVVRDPETEKLIRRDLAEQTGDLGGTGTVTFETTLGIGRIGGHLLDLAEAQKADVVVVGTHGKRGPLRLASVSGVVLHHARSSVVCAPAAGRVGSERREVRCVLVPTDFSDCANAAIAAAYSLLEGRPGGEVHLLHVADPQGLAEGSAALVAKLRALVPEWAMRYGIVTHAEVVHRANAGDAIRAAAARVGADVICMASHGRRGLRRAVLGSVAEDVVRNASGAVMIVRPPEP